jgi:hypothetical protein
MAADALRQQSPTGGQAVPPPAQEALPAPSAAHRKCTNPGTFAAKSSRRPRRDRCPNWNLYEMLALVDAKRKEYMDEFDVVDTRDLMDPETIKWTRISERVMASGHSPCVRDH